jgi:formylglycine-generating enzyme required for sulfatase activity/energy-coupling factor transporter ATP-binding protein EcfA2
LSSPALPPSGPVEAGQNIDARDIITGIQNNFSLIFQVPFQPPPDLAQLRADYLAYLHDSYRYLDMKGLMQVRQVARQLSLAAVYVPLKARSRRGAGRARRVAGRAWAEEAIAHLVELPAAADPRPIDEALKRDPALVVLGDPGAGKSTLLKIMALALAEAGDGPLPIPLPLNAYARRLAQGEISLSQFLGQYYAARQNKLGQVGVLFEQALADGQAVVLLDGLDEVQTNRRHLVRLVQDFAAEHIPMPANADDTGDDHVIANNVVVANNHIVSGNRIVVTSRIVGYDEAPLAGRQWRTHTLTDFEEGDIEQFVSQWTLAFALSVQGDTAPARQAAQAEQRDLLAAIKARPSVRRLAANPLLLTILALIKYTGVSLPEERVKLYELYLQALIESWNQARSLDQYPVGPGLKYEETIRILAPLALWLRQTNPTAGLVSRDQLEAWLTSHFHGPEWGLPRGQARQRGLAFLAGVEQYTNLLLERGERQYGFLHLTLEEMLAAQGLAYLLDLDKGAALALFEQYLAEPGWHETLQLAISFVGVIQRRPRQAGELLQHLLALKLAETGASAIFAGQILLDAGLSNISRPAAEGVIAALAETMTAPACPIARRRDAGDLLGRLGWRPEAAAGDFLLAPQGVEPTGLDAFRPVPGRQILIGKYPVSNAQFARFIEGGGYEKQQYWSETGWAWRSGRYDSQAPPEYQDWLKERPPERRDRPFFWEERRWNSPLYPVVGVSWFEAEAYTRWLTGNRGRLLRWPDRGRVRAGVEVRLPREEEWEAAMGGRGDYDYPWGETFDPARLNCADSWAGEDLSDYDDWRKWLDSASFQEAGLTAVTTYPQGASLAGVWDGSGNVWEWMGNPHEVGGQTIALRGGSWALNQRYARVSSRAHDNPGYFFNLYGFRCVVAPV